MVADLLAAWRHLRRSPAHVVIVVISLGVGMAVSAAAFSVMNALAFEERPGIETRSTSGQHPLERRRRPARRAGLRRGRAGARRGLLSGRGGSPSFAAGCPPGRAHHRARVVRVPAVFRRARNATGARPFADAVRCGARCARGRADWRALLAGELRGFCRRPRPGDHDRRPSLHDCRRRARGILRTDPPGRGAGRRGGPAGLASAASPRGGRGTFASRAVVVRGGPPPARCAGEARPGRARVRGLPAENGSRGVARAHGVVGIPRRDGLARQSVRGPVGPWRVPLRAALRAGDRLRQRHQPAVRTAPPNEVARSASASPSARRATVLPVCSVSKWSFSRRSPGSPAGAARWRYCSWPRRTCNCPSPSIRRR